MGLTIMRELLSPELTKTGHGLYLSPESLLFVSSRCCGYPMYQDTGASAVSGIMTFKCMNDSVDVTRCTFDSSVDISKDPDEDGSARWNLDGWAKAWTGLEGIRVNITYM